MILFLNVKTNVKDLKLTNCYQNKFPCSLSFNNVAIGYLKKPFLLRKIPIMC